MLDQIASFIQGHDRFAISTHISPEADALGSALAVYWALKRLGKRTVVVMRDPVPRNLDFLPGAAQVVGPGAFDDDAYEQAIFVDCARANRVGEELYERFQGRFLINLDHHGDNPRFGNLHHVRDRASATMVVDELLDALELPLNEALATCLYAGLVADTGAFCNANADAEAMASASKWVLAGADPHWISKNMFERQRLNEVQLMAHALAGAELRDGVVWCAVTHEAFCRYGVHPNDTDGIIGQLRSIDGAEVAVLFKEVDPGKVKVSLRAKGAASVNGIAQRFGGGGHVRAAGCFVEGALEAVAQDVLTCAWDELKAAPGAAW